MKIIPASFEILTNISPYATLELEQIERIARTCYKSEDKITDQGESARKLIRNLIDRGHEAMLEHSQLSVKFICDRGVSHELVRHRMASFAQESTRYCNYSKDKFGNELTFVRPPWVNEAHLPKAGVKFAWNDLSNEEKTAQLWYYSCRNFEAVYLALLSFGWTPQEARAVLPNSLKTEVVVTANYREWRHILELRCAATAHPQMRELMLPLLSDLHDLIPVVFDDLYELYYEMPRMEGGINNEHSQL